MTRPQHTPELARENRKLLAKVAAKMIVRGFGDVPTVADIARTLGVPVQTAYHWRNGLRISKPRRAIIEQYMTGTPARSGEGNRADTSSQA